MSKWRNTPDLHIDSFAANLPAKLLRLRSEILRDCAPRREDTCGIRQFNPEDFQYGLS